MRISAYDHVGIRVTDRARALAFYERLGFVVDEALSNERVAEMTTPQDVRINLIFNGVSTPDGRNILLDHPDKWPGFTHAAFVVDRLQTVLDWARREGVAITEGPVDWGRRLTCFLRDPDGNVLEFNQLVDADGAAPKRPLRLVIGSKNYSSWSMRAWLLLRWLGLPFEEISVPLYRPDSRSALLRYSPAARVPVLIDDDLTIWDTLAIVQHLADRCPELWPADPHRRAYARSVCAEMHAGFGAMRSAMSYNARARGRRVPETEALRADVARVQDIWAEGQQRFGGPWLVGEFGIADIMFAPPAARFVTYGVEVRDEVRDYHQRLLAHPLVAEWFALGQADEVIPECEVGTPA